MTSRSWIPYAANEKRGEVGAEEQAAIANETSDASSSRSEANKPTA